MKLTTVLILAVTMQISATVYSQSTKFSMDFKGKTVREVFNIIEGQSRFRFFFNDDFRLIDEKVNLDVKDVSVEAILDELFLNSDISYKVLPNDLIVLTASNNQGLAPVNQSKTIKGKVVDVAGLPLPGVTVYFKGTTGWNYHQWRWNIQSSCSCKCQNIGILVCRYGNQRNGNWQSIGN